MEYYCGRNCRATAPGLRCRKPPSPLATIHESLTRMFQCNEVSYHDNGAVKVCVTPEKIQYEGKELPLATRLCFDAQGGQTTEGDPRCMKW